MIYRDVKLEFDGNFIKLINLNHVNQSRAMGLPKDDYPLGYKIASIPEKYLNKPVVYAKLLVDRTYNWANYHKRHEFVFLR